MSAEILDWVRRHSPTKRADRLLLLTMADLADDDGYLVASALELAGPCNSNRNAIAKTQARLRKQGAIEICARTGANGAQLSNGYFVIAGQTMRAMPAACASGV